MDTVFEINGVFSAPSRLGAPELAEGFIQLPACGRGHKKSSAPRRRPEAPDIDATEVSTPDAQACEAFNGAPKAMIEKVGFSLAVLAIIGLGTLGGWAVTLVFNSLMQAQSLVVQNSFVFHR